MIVLRHFLKTIREAASYNPEVQLAPACILWPDHDRQWEDLIPRLLGELPELLVLGDYAPDERTGPAIWLRCAMAGRVSEVTIPNATEQTPIIYLPGVSRQDLRAIESCPNNLKPLAELQYRGIIWSQINAKDWTILAYLKSSPTGLGLNIVQDNNTKKAMHGALEALFEMDIEALKGKQLDADYFNSLLTSGDFIRDLLNWLDHSDVFMADCYENEWEAFIGLCKERYGFNPQNEGVLTGSAKLANHNDSWQAVWERFCEAPERYPNIPSQIRGCRRPETTLFGPENDELLDGWPQWNDEQEINLRIELKALAKVLTHEVWDEIQELEKKHGHRRSWIWAELEQSPLACALEHLATIAEYTRLNPATGSIDDLVTRYYEHGWKIDDGLIKALAHVSDNNFEAVSTAIRSVYLPWAEESARYLQKIVYDSSSYPDVTRLTTKEGDCILFVDGLRFDVGKRLSEMLKNSGLEVSEEPVWAALPSVTATGKPAVSPVAHKIFGEEGNTDFEPVVSSTGQSLKGGYHLPKLLAEDGWSTLEQSANGNGQGKAWCEFGNIDKEGHHRGWKLAKHMDGLLVEIVERLKTLLIAGWKRVHIVTDHGWLLLPEALPKIELTQALTEHKWGRCASLKPGASAEGRYPWYWNPNQYFALANGISCFKNGEEYAHGGLSLQECLTLHLTVTPGKSNQTATVKFTNVAWVRLRCTVTVDGNCTGFSLDVRRQANDASSSLLGSVKPFKDNGKASVAIDGDFEGNKVMLVIIDADGTLVTQQETLIGGEE